MVEKFHMESEAWMPNFHLDFERMDCCCENQILAWRDGFGIHD
jgi:hypothetical protein